MRHLRLLTCLSSLALAGCAAATSGAVRPPSTPFMNLFMTPTEGRVGYFVQIQPRVSEFDVPVFPCSFRVAAAEVEGTLPVGLTLPPGKLWIEGTPRQPGTWTFSYILRDIYCSLDPTQQRYGDRRINVTFTVNP